MSSSLTLRGRCQSGRWLGAVAPVRPRLTGRGALLGDRGVWSSGLAPSATTRLKRSRRSSRPRRSSGRVASAAAASWRSPRRLGSGAARGDAACAYVRWCFSGCTSSPEREGGVRVAFAPRAGRGGELGGGMGAVRVEGAAVNQVCDARRIPASSLRWRGRGAALGDAGPWRAGLPGAPSGRGALLRGSGAGSAPAPPCATGMFPSRLRFCRPRAVDPLPAPDLVLASLSSASERNVRAASLSSMRLAVTPSALATDWRVSSYPRLAASDRMLAAPKRCDTPRRGASSL
eukprot:scaffold4268_cov56-Phaeocystis_antarctica.AAC.3